MVGHSPSGCSGTSSRHRGSINYSKMSWSSKAAPDLHSATTMYDCWYDVYEILCYTTRNRTQTLQKVCLVSPQNTFSKVFFFWQMWDDSLCSLWSAVIFSLELSSSLFLIVEACSSLDGALGSFVISWMSRRCVLGKVHHHSLKSQSLEVALYPFTD